VANKAAAARARRRLEKSGGKNLPTLCLHDHEGWCEVLREEGHLPRDSGEVDLFQARRATEDWIKELCRAYRRQHADKLIHVRTGVLKRTEPPPEERSIRFDPGGGHWSFKPGHKRDRGRTYSRAEIEAFLEERAELRAEALERWTRKSPGPSAKVWA
jgi:hypothetical protein